MNSCSGCYCNACMCRALSVFQFLSGVFIDQHMQSSLMSLILCELLLALQLNLLNFITSTPKLLASNQRWGWKLKHFLGMCYVHIYFIQDSFFVQVVYYLFVCFDRSIDLTTEHTNTLSFQLKANS